MDYSAKQLVEKFNNKHKVGDLCSFTSILNYYIPESREVLSPAKVFKGLAVVKLKGITGLAPVTIHHFKELLTEK